MRDWPWYAVTSCIAIGKLCGHCESNVREKEKKKRFIQHCGVKSTVENSMGGYSNSKDDALFVGTASQPRFCDFCATAHL